MKRITIKAILPDKTEKAIFTQTIESQGGELERYEEYKIPKDADVLEEHSINALLYALKDTANGAWLIIKGIGLMTKWSLIIVWSGLRWLWKNGLGSNDDKQEQDKQAHGRQANQAKDKE